MIRLMLNVFLSVNSQQIIIYPNTQYYPEERNIWNPWKEILYSMFRYMLELLKKIFPLKKDDSSPEYISSSLPSEPL